MMKAQNRRKNLFAILIVVLLPMSFFIFHLDNTDFKSGFYIPDDIIVHSKDKDFPPSLEQQIKSVLGEYYVQIDNNNLIVFENTYPHFFDLTTKRTIKLANVPFTFLQDSQHHIYFTSRGKDLCGYECTIKFTLVPVDEDNKKLYKIQQDQQAYSQEQIAFYTRMKQQLPDMNHYILIGDHHNMMPDSVILPVYYTMRNQKNVSYNEWIDDIYIDLSNDKTLMFVAESTDHSSNSYSKFIYVTAEKDKFDFSRWLKNKTQQLEAILYQDDNSAIFYSNKGYLEAFYFDYDENKQQYLFASSLNLSPDNLHETLQHYASFKTLKKINKGQVLSTEFIQYSPQVFQQQFGKLYNVDKTYQQLQEAIDEKLQLESLLKNYGDSVRVNLFDISDVTSRIVVTHQSIKQIQQEMSEFLTTKEDGFSQYQVIYQDEQVLIFQNVKDSEDRISYYYLSDNGLTYCVSFEDSLYLSKEKRHLIRHLRFINTMRSLPPIQLNHHPINILKQVRQFDFVDKAEDILNQEHYIVRQQNKGAGIINQRAEIIIPIKHASIFSSGHNGYIVGDEIVIEKDEGYQVNRSLYGYANAQGEFLLNIEYDKIEYQKDDLYSVVKSINGQNHEGIFNIRTRRWESPLSPIFQLIE